MNVKTLHWLQRQKPVVCYLLCALASLVAAAITVVQGQPAWTGILTGSAT